MITINSVLTLRKTFIINHARHLFTARLLCRISCLSGCTIFKRRKNSKRQWIYICLFLIAVAIFRNWQCWAAIEGISWCSRRWCLNCCQLNRNIFWQRYICNRCHMIWLIWYIFQICRTLIHTCYKSYFLRFFGCLKRKIFKACICHIIKNNCMTRIFFFKTN